MTDRADRLAEARDAHRRREWSAAYDALSGLRRTGPLDGDDLAALSDAAWWLGLIRQSLEACEEGHDRFLADGRLDRAAMLAIEAGFSWSLRGEPEIGAGWVSRARRLLAGQPTGTAQAMLMWMDARARAEAGDVEGALHDCDRLRTLGGELGEPVVGCLALALEGSLVVLGGDTARGFELLDEAMLPALAGRIPPDFAGNLYCQMLSVCHEVGDVPRARRWTEATQRWTDTFTSAAMFVGVCRVHRSQLLRLSGEWAAAEREAAAANHELAELNVEAVGEARYELGETHRLRGDLDGARAWYAAAAELGRSPEPGVSLVLLESGRHDEALAGVQQALLEEGEPCRRARLLAAHVEIAVEAGRADLAEDPALELEALAHRFGTPGLRAWAGQARGTALLGADDPEGALPHLRVALFEYDAMGAAYDAATCRALLGKAFGALGDDRAAHVETEAGRRAFEDLGATPRVAWLTRLTAGVAGPTTLPGGLTERETQILALVAEGSSNREVARRLVISEKTVARHLANVYLKLGVGSRTAASAWAHRQGLVAPSAPIGK